MAGHEPLAQCEVARARIEARLANGDEKFDRIMVKLDGIEQKIDAMNGSHEIRIDRLEQSERWRTWMARTTAGSVIVLAVGMVWKWLVK